MKRVQDIFIASILLTGLLSFSGGWFFATRLPAAAPAFGTAAVNSASSLEIGSTTLPLPHIDEVWSKLKNSYYDAEKLEPQKLGWSAVEGFVAGLEDRYTAFMNPETSKEFDDGLEGFLEGIGAELDVEDGKLTIVKPLKNSPAEEAGLLPGDIIAKIGGEPTDHMTVGNAVNKIRGKGGTQVKLTIIRKGAADSFDVSITRRQIALESTEFKKLDNDIVYLALFQFNDHAKRE
ncbi:PDZ domain-containing protein, partial [Candidatus Peregrinibacteria bacterium]|nr:PDZ domain-containing protein [Candidatus Peregrinibacteria bacterium]